MVYGVTQVLKVIRDADTNEVVTQEFIRQKTGLSIEACYVRILALLGRRLITAKGFTDNTEFDITDRGIAFLEQ